MKQKHNKQFFALPQMLCLIIPLSIIALGFGIYLIIDRYEAFTFAMGIAGTIGGCILVVISILMCWWSKVTVSNNGVSNTEYVPRFKRELRFFKWEEISSIARIKRQKYVSPAIILKTFDSKEIRFYERKKAIKILLEFCTNERLKQQLEQYLY